MDRSHVKNILPKRLEEYMQEAEYDLHVDEMNIHDKVLLRSSLGAKWCRYSFEEEKYKKQIIDKIEQLREQIKQNLYNQKKQAITTSNIALQKLIALDTEKALIQDPTYKKLKEALSNQEDIIRLINEIQKQIAQFSYDLTNCKEILKLENI